MRHTPAQKEYDDVRMKYEGIFKEYVITKGYDTKINEVWNVYTVQEVPEHDFFKAGGKQRGES